MYFIGIESRVEGSEIYDEEHHLNTIFWLEKGRMIRVYNRLKRGLLSPSLWGWVALPVWQHQKGSMRLHDKE